jgi:phosphatidylglycerophosphate synthase
VRLRSSLLPGVLSASRAASAPLLFWCVVADAPVALSAGLLSLAAASDVLDGYLARRHGVCSGIGGHLDATADLLVTGAAFSAFALEGVYPPWAPLLIGGTFLQFVLTSGRGSPRYDPVGRHYGTFLYCAVAATLLLPDFALLGTVLAMLVVLTAVSVACRTGFLLVSKPAEVPTTDVVGGTPYRDGGVNVGDKRRLAGFRASRKPKRRGLTL